MKRVLLLGLLLTLVSATLVYAGDYNYVTPDNFKTWLETGKKMAIVDIQPSADFQKHHFAGSLETNAYPVKTDEERQRLDKTVPLLTAATVDIVVVCPRGGGGAKGTYDYLKSKGIDEKRLLILESGMQGWPHKSLTISGK